MPDIHSDISVNARFLGIGNGGGKQGRGNQPPISTIRTRYGNSVSTPEATWTCKPSRILSEREAHTESQYRPHIVDTNTIAAAFLADAVSETSMVE